jgi:hypothetical protein
MLTLASASTDWISAIANVFAAVGTVGAVIVALFPHQIRNWIWPPSAVVELVDPAGDATYINGTQRVYLFHLRVRNSSEHRGLHGCAVFLEEVSTRTADGVWRSVRLPVPVTLRWAPMELMPLQIDVQPGSEATADLVWFRELPDLKAAVVQPVLATYPANFPGSLTSEGAMRYHLALRANELTHPVRTTIEVEWNGKWPHNPNALTSALAIRRISAVAG